MQNHLFISKMHSFHRDVWGKKLFIVRDGYRNPVGLLNETIVLISPDVTGSFIGTI